MGRPPKKRTEEQEEEFTQEEFLKAVRTQYDELRGTPYGGRRTAQCSFAGITQYQLLIEALAIVAYSLFRGEFGKPDREEKGDEG